MWDNQDFLILVAAGNSGGQGGGSVGSPATAKSVLSVGASLSTKSSFEQNGLNPNNICTVPGQPCTESMASFSSLGPLPSDTRLKPEVSAPGALTWSAMSKANNQYQCPTSVGQQLTKTELNNLVFPTQGTSMATPTTAGNAALVRQYFTDGFYPSGVATRGGGGGGGDDRMLPMGSLLKAMLMNSAKPMNGKHGTKELGGTTAGNSAAVTGTKDRAGIQISRSTPTYSQRNLAGVGLTILDRVLYLKKKKDEDDAIETEEQHSLFAIGEFGNNMMVATSLKTKEEKIYTFHVRPGRPFKVTLVWTDAPGSTAAQRALVNDLDLEVRAGGTLYIPNGFEDSELDTINPFEQVEVYEPTEQIYLVRVVGTQIIQSHSKTLGQPFSLVVTGNFNKNLNLYPFHAPILTSTTSQIIVIGEKNRWVVQGIRLDGRIVVPEGRSSMVLKCEETLVENVVVTSGSDTTLTIEIQKNGWICPGGVVKGIWTTSNGFISEQVQVGVALTKAEAEASGNTVVGADGIVQVAPDTQVERQNICQGFSNVTEKVSAETETESGSEERSSTKGSTFNSSLIENNCLAIEFCQFDKETTECSAKLDGLGGGWIFLIIVLVLGVIGGSIYLVYLYLSTSSQGLDWRNGSRSGGHGGWRGPRGGGGGGGGGGSGVGKKPAAAAVGQLPTAVRVAVPAPEVPVRPSRKKPPLVGKKPLLQSGWKPQIDPSSGDTYYYNAKTGALFVSWSFFFFLSSSLDDEHILFNCCSVVI